MNRFYIPADDNGHGALVARLQEVARHARTHYARHLKDTGLHAGQERVIDVLAANGPMTPGALADILGVRPPTITKTIGRLQEQGFVERARSDADRRQVVVTLTAMGRNVLDTMQKSLTKAQKQTLKGLKKKERKQLDKILTKLEANLGLPKHSVGPKDGSDDG